MNKNNWLAVISLAIVISTMDTAVNAADKLIPSSGAGRALDSRNAVLHWKKRQVNRVAEMAAAVKAADAAAKVAMEQVAIRAAMEQEAINAAVKSVIESVQQSAIQRLGGSSNVEVLVDTARQIAIKAAIRAAAQAAADAEAEALRQATIQATRIVEIAKAKKRKLEEPNNQS